MRVGSLFSGIGGIELGLERAGGFETAWFVESDPHAQAILRKHWPSTPIHADVTTVDFVSLPKVDLLTGGFPCQDISNAGKRAGITGNRSSLWKHYLRAIVSLRPRLVFAENVAALTQRGLDVVLVDLAAIGYDAEWHCVPAAAVGAHHRRDRIIILAYPHDGGHIHGQPGEQSNQGGKAQHDARQSSQDVVYADRGGFDEDMFCCERGDSCKESLPDADKRSGCDDLADGDSGCLQAEEVCSRRDAPFDGCEDVSDAEGEGLERRIEGGGLADAVQGTWSEDPAESGMGRVAHGVPHWVDRIKRLGNAVVPQWAQAVGEAINESMNRKP